MPICSTSPLSSPTARAVHADGAGAPPPTAAPASVAICANPYSGRGPNRRRVDALVAALEARRINARLVWDRNERVQLLSDPSLSEWCRCVIAAGGDGSIADVVNDLSGGRREGAGAPATAGSIAFATLPIGNENLFARQFGFDAGPERIAEAIARGRTRRIDVGLMEGAGQPRLFTIMASAGFDAQVVHRVDRWRRGADKLKRVNRLSYVPHILGAIRRYSYPAVTLEAGGRTVTGTHAFVFNIPQYGGRLGIGRHADEADGKLDWIVFHRPGLIRLAMYGLSVIARRHLRRVDVSHGRAASVTLTAATPVPLQADGDPAGTTPASFTVRPAALSVIAV